MTDKTANTQTKTPRWISVPITEGMASWARRADCYECLLAVALREATGLVWHVMQDDARIETLRGRKPIWKFPPSIRSLVARFDGGETIEPQEFNLPARFADSKWKQLGAEAHKS